jgi:hypothetical protein
MLRRGIAVIILVVAAFACAPVRADDVVPRWPASPDQVLSDLRRSLSWAQYARQVTQSANNAASGVIVDDDQQAVMNVLKHAFELARAEVPLVPVSELSTAPTHPDVHAARRQEVEERVRVKEREIASSQAQLKTVPRARRAAVERDIVLAQRQLELDRLALEFFKGMDEIDTSMRSGELDLVQQIKALEESVPELTGKGQTQRPVVTQPPGSGTWPVIRRLFTLYRTRGALDQLRARTLALARVVDGDFATVRGNVRTFGNDLRALAAAPEKSEQDFRAQLSRVRLYAAVLPPLRAQSALLHRFVEDIGTWQQRVNRETRLQLEELGLQLIGVVVALLLVFVGSVLWRIAATRYITDPYRRRLALSTRNVVVVLVVLLIFIFRFTTELTALVTALGFAAAGIAFALQNVILSIAGYFSMVAPNGIRVGDRVGLQGPFGYVNGEVIEIGFVKIRLRELAPDTLQPTGRTVVFPNSVVFTGSFFKLPASPSVRAA